MIVPEVNSNLGFKADDRIFDSSPESGSWQLEVARSRFFSSTTAVFRFDFTAGTVSFSGNDAEYYINKLGTATLPLKNFTMAIFGTLHISGVSLIGGKIAVEQFFSMLVSEIIRHGGFVELNSGKESMFAKRDSIRLYEDYIFIQHGGAINAMTEMGIQGGKQVLIDHVTAIQVKSPGFTAGYLQFSIKGEVASKGGVFSAYGDENTITTYGKFAPLVGTAIRDYIFDWQRKHRPVK